LPSNLPAQGIADALRSSAPLVRLGERMRQSNAFLAAVGPAIHAGLAAHIRAGPVDDEGWSLLCANASVAAKLRRVGVEHVDVSGAGGTSWVAVETQRARAEKKALGQAFWEWGVPTAASVAWVHRHGFQTVFATGGMQNGLDIAKAIALGASAGGIARAALQALERGGPSGARQFFAGVEAELRAALLLTGSANVAALRRAPRVITGELKDWLSQPAD